LIGLVSVGTSLNSNNSNKKSDKKQIAVSIFPYRDLVQEIAGDDFEVVLVFEENDDPHSFEPAPVDIAKILDSDIYFYNGEIDQWAGEILEKNTFDGEVFKVENGTKFKEVGDDHYDDNEHGEHNDGG